MFLTRIALLSAVVVIAAASANTTSTPPTDAVDAAVKVCRLGGVGATPLGVFDAHLHLTQTTANQTGAALLEELDSAGVDGGLVYAVYGPMAATTDANAEVARLLSTGKGRLLGLASLNTSDWADQGARQLGNLKTFLALPGFVGVKLANPHTCLAFNDPKMADIARVAAAAGKGVYVHTGTTPFCPNGTLGRTLATPACCDAPYVDVTLLEPLIKRHVDIPWVLLHSGYDFTPAASVKLTEDAIRLASVYPNVFIETAVNFADEPYPRDLPTARYPVPGGRAVLQKIRDAGVLDKALFGSDGTFILTLVWAMWMTSCFVCR